jgi:hypothetical protein
VSNYKVVLRCDATIGLERERERERKRKREREIGEKYELMFKRRNRECARFPGERVIHS